MSDEEIMHVTLDQAVKMGRRAICAEDGHTVERAVFLRNWNGIALDGYACSSCDVQVELSYPD